MVRKTLTVAFLIGLVVLGQPSHMPETQEEAISPVLGNVVPLNYLERSARDILVDQSKVALLQRYGTIRTVEQCFRQPETAWCSGIAGVETPMLSKNVISLISRNTVQHFTYAAEEKDEWLVYSEEVTNNTGWSGDCDDLTSTTLHLLNDNGQPLDGLWMLLVSVKGSDIIDHVIGVAQDNNGELWVVGDTSRSRNTYPLADLQHRPMLITRLDDIHNWVPVTESPVFDSLQNLVGAFEAENQ